MTRKTRTRRPRIQSLQSGYCEICHQPYNNLEEHIHSKRHQKLIGDDGAYIAVNGFLSPHSNIETFLNLNIDTALDNGALDPSDISPRPRRRNMPRTRAASVVCERVKPSPLSPAHSEIIGHHHLRSRRNINYMTPPLDEDSLPESDKTDFSPPPTPVDHAQNRELRSSSRILSKLQENQEKDDVWSSGRPKRACINKRRRTSIDERLLADHPKAYYKVEVLSSKLRSSQTRELEVSKAQSLEDKEKGLIVKFKKLRNSELVQLNNEASNFLFPSKKDNSEEEDEEEGGDPDADCANSTVSTTKNDSTLLISSEEDAEEETTSMKFKVEDEASMDSVSSEKRKKKRRTHAEAFINDNHKYYKFEMPGSSSCRLRYQGSYLPPSVDPPLKSPKGNGDCTQPKVEKEEKPEIKKPRLKLADYKFSFERVPRNEQWYSTFRRQDTGEMRFPYFSDFYWDSFIMPYQMNSIQPMDPKKCIQHYVQVKKLLQDPPSCCSDGSTTPDQSVTNSTPSEELHDEDSKISTITTSSTSTLTEDSSEPLMKRNMKRKKMLTMSPSSSKNPRKSPRQHASTLAILSSLIQQRKRKSRSLDDSKTILPCIPEETKEEEPPKVEEKLEEPAEPVRKRKIIVCSRKPRKILKRKPVVKIDYNLLANKIEDEINSTLEEEDNFEEIEQPEDSVDFKNSTVQFSDILTMHDKAFAKEDEKSARRFFNGTPGRKPGRRKKKNKTGWPNKNKRLLKKEQVANPEKEEDNSTIGSCSEQESEEEECERDLPTTDNASIINDKKLSESVEKSDNSVSEKNCDQEAKVLTTNAKQNVEYHPYVCVQKLSNEKILKSRVNVTTSPPAAANATAKQRTSGRRQRRMPGSPKSPRMLRKPRGRWYRER
ncbi:unnamed protein product [Brassicogethes aeneus]|uniref:DBF4-type domain-containing protein n=1 Tax=Brassicogethes aeneus TaxID=1431903 RepID=A0A9P0B3Y4_BRAAE|nr:unnamed protein product [Brassicogethes aeneus]